MKIKKIKNSSCGCQVLLVSKQEIQNERVAKLVFSTKKSKVKDFFVIRDINKEKTYHIIFNKILF
jgi:hypothetical protein